MDELIKRLRASCESCKLWDGEKCCIKGECSAQTRLQAADAIEELQAAEKKYLANISALETENQHLKREREWMPVENTRDFNTVTSDLIRHLRLSCQRTDGEILWYEGTIEVLVEFLSILHQKAEEGE